MAGSTLPVSFALAGSDSSSLVRVVLAKLCGGSASVANETTGLPAGANTRNLVLPTSLAAGAAHVYAEIASGTGAGARSAAIAVTVTQFVDPCGSSQSSALSCCSCSCSCSCCPHVVSPCLQLVTLLVASHDPSVAVSTSCSAPIRPLCILAAALHLSPLTRC